MSHDILLFVVFPIAIVGAIVTVVIAATDWRSDVEVEKAPAPPLVYRIRVFAPNGDVVRDFTTSKQWETDDGELSIFYDDHDKDLLTSLPYLLEEV